MEQEAEFIERTMPPTEVLAMLGNVNIAWSILEGQVTAALFSLLEINEFELTILLGKMEIQNKVGKIQQILAHRKKPIKYVSTLVKELDKLRPDRNALTHGIYQGQSKGEYIFHITVDPLLEPDVPSAYKMRTFESGEISKHILAVLAITNELRNHFDVTKMQKLYLGPLRVPKQFLATAPQGKSKKKHQPPHQ
jgi:hypothetical protein